MQALLVVESMFGNTREIADAVVLGLKSGLPPAVETSIVDVNAAAQRLEPTVVFLIVGAPTHAFGMSRPNTRKAAIEQGATSGPGIGVREWLKTFEPRRGLPVASFDTRIKKRGVPGSAAKAVMRRLTSKGGDAIDSPHSFFVSGTDGPLLDGEIDQAQQWGHQLAAAVRPGLGAHDQLR